MLARWPLPAEFEAWNSKWDAPFGRTPAIEAILPKRVARRLERAYPKVKGPFGFQVNNQTRMFEYPWAYFQIGPSPGMRAVDIGGSNAGLQFVLAKEGADVTNVDPGKEASGRGWSVNQDSISRLNRGFGTNVRLINSTLQAASLPSDHFDIAYSISTIEHIPVSEHASLMSDLRRILKPGGRLVLTIDLFLDLEPFSSRQSNKWGTNIDLAELVQLSGMQLVEGEPSQLHGFPEFDPREVMGDLEHYFFGSYPACAQCLVLKK